MEKISLSVLVLWVAIGVSLSAIYIPILSDSEELLFNTLNSATGDILGNDFNFSLPLVSLIQGELNKDYFEISPSSDSLVTSPQNTVNIPTINLPATITPISPSPTTPSTGTNTDTSKDTSTPDTPSNTDKDTSSSDIKKNSSIKPGHIPNYTPDYHNKYHRHYHMIHNPHKISRHHAHN